MRGSSIYAHIDIMSLCQSSYHSLRKGCYPHQRYSYKYIFWSTALPVLSFWFVMPSSHYSPFVSNEAKSIRSKMDLRLFCAYSVPQVPFEQHTRLHSETKNSTQFQIETLILLFLLYFFVLYPFYPFVYWRKIQTAIWGYE